MPGYTLGAHTYVFTQYGYDAATQHDEILRCVADAGFDSVELFAPALDAPDWKERVLHALQRSGLRLVGVSSGAPFWDVERRGEILRSMEAFCAKLTGLDLGPLHCGCSVSGKRFAERTEAENEQCVALVTETASMFRAAGHRMNYHTHGEPIEDIDLIVDNVPGDVLELGPDLDWLRVGGVDPESFVRAHSERISMLHIRDYHLGGERTEALGEGDADYRRLGMTLAEIGFSGECVVELAIPPGRKGSRSPLELLSASRQHVRTTMNA